MYNDIREQASDIMGRLVYSPAIWHKFIMDVSYRGCEIKGLGHELKG